MSKDGRCWCFGETCWRNVCRSTLPLDRRQRGPNDESMSKECAMSEETKADLEVLRFDRCGASLADNHSMRTIMGMRFDISLKQELVTSSLAALCRDIGAVVRYMAGKKLSLTDVSAAPMGIWTLDGQFVNELP